MAETLDRIITLEGAVNFRDLGGYEAGAGTQTRWRTLFRADGLGELTEADLDAARWPNAPLDAIHDCYVHNTEAGIVSK